jgi:hypothetical protein
MTKLDGDYDNESEQLLVDTNATAVLVVVLDGRQGDGFSVSTSDARVLNALPAMLRDVAGSIERQIRAGMPQPVKVTAVPRKR